MLSELRIVWVVELQILILPVRRICVGVWHRARLVVVWLYQLAADRRACDIIV